MTELKYDVETKITDTGIIDQTVSSSFNGVKEVLFRQIMKTMDVQAQKALVELGWTPPKGHTIER